MPTLIDWNDRLVLGIASVDRQHRELAEQLNLLSPLVEAHAYSSERLTHILASLYQHTCAHFEHEERLMADIDYSGLQSHHDEHRMLLAELKSFVRQIENGTAFFDLRSLLALRDWLVVHIVDSDRSFAEEYRRYYDR